MKLTILYPGKTKECAIGHRHISNESLIVDAVREFYQVLYKENQMKQNSDILIIENISSEDILSITLHGIKNAAKTVETNISPGDNGMVIEVVKYSCPPRCRNVYALEPVPRKIDPLEQ